MKRTIAAALLAALCALAAGGAAAAENSLGTEGDRPWAAGVPKEQQAQATELFLKGNALLNDAIFVQAAATYREALKLWDHPAIHYNLVLALLTLDQPVEVLEHLTSALRFGPGPLDPDKFLKAQGFKADTERKLARVKIACELEGAQVVMDGTPLFVGPGSYEGWVRPGPHTVVGTREGYLTNEVSRALPAGETVAIKLELKTAAELTEYRRRWGSNWIPWTVLGAGAAVALAGGGLHFGGIDEVRSFDAGITDCGGCVPDAGLAGKRDTGATMQQLGIGAYAVGGAAVVTGAVLLYMNRLQPYELKSGAAATPEDGAAPPADGTAPPADGAAPAPDGGEVDLSLSPFFGEQSRGLLASLRF